MKLLIVTWQGGGAVQPAIGLGRLLRERGHQVRILGPAAFAERVAAAACRHRPFPVNLEFDPSQGRAADDQWPHVFSGTLMGSALPALISGEIEADTPDVVVVDFMLRSAACVLEKYPIPRVLLIHTTHRFHGRQEGDPDAEWGWRWHYRQINEMRAAMGLPALPIGPHNPTTALSERSAAALVVMPREFDDWPDPPSTVFHVGPIVEESTGSDWDTPWSPDDRHPLIVVSLGTTYMHQEDLLDRICIALSEIDARVLLLTGMELAPEEVGSRAQVEVRDYVPHGAVFPKASLVITHGGMGTLMAAFTAGVPVLCIPLGRDQNSNASRA